jgi:ABC-type multidrug transport system ATPase subunit
MGGTIGHEFGKTKNMNFKLSQLKKEFRGFTLGPIDLELIKGESVVIFGPNGAGKSTLFQIMTGNMDASDGLVEVDGERFFAENFLLKRRIGYLPQSIDLPKWVTPLEILRYAAKLHEFQDADQRVSESIAYWDLNHFSDRAIASCSYGMQKRIGLALATLHAPEFLILDEPFSGLDVLHLKALNAYLTSRNLSGKTSLISTHGTAYVNRLCSRALLIINGKLSEVSQWQSWSNDQKESEIENRFN